MKNHSPALVKYTIALSACIILAFSLNAAPPSKTRGVGTGQAGMKHRGKGGMPSDFKANIHALFSNHEAITRKVELTKTGYRATTTSDDSKLVSTLHVHVKQMQGRLEEGKSVRRWDPAYAEMMDHYADIEVKITPIKNGIQAEMIGKTENAIKIAQNHASVLSKFVDKGDVEMHKPHPGVLAGNTVVDSVSKGKGGCGKGNCCLTDNGKGDDCEKPAVKASEKK